MLCLPWMDILCRHNIKKVSVETLMFELPRMTNLQPCCVLIPAPPSPPTGTYAQTGVKNT